MELDERRLRAVRDGEPLHVLENGIVIVRRVKHEPKDFTGLSKAEVERQTNKTNGSKFLPGTTLAQIVTMTADVLRENQAVCGTTKVYNKTCGKPIGISRGREVRCLRVQVNGRWAHGFPVEG